VRSSAVLALGVVVLLASGLKADDFAGRFVPAEFAGLGETYAASSGGASSCWLNPSAPGNRPAFEYSLDFRKGFADVDLYCASFFYSGTKWWLGLSGGQLGTAPEPMVDMNDVPQGSDLLYRKLLFGVSGGMEFKGMRVGLNLRYADSQLGPSSDPVLLVGAGWSRDFGPVSAGLLLRDIGLIADRGVPSGEFRLGLSYDLRLLPVFSAVAAADGFYSMVNSAPGIHASLGFHYRNFLRLRIGLTPEKKDIFSFGAGFTVRLRDWDLKADYALEPFLSGSSLAHSVGFTMTSRKTEINAKVRDSMSKISDFTNQGDFEGALKELDDAVRTGANAKKMESLKKELQSRMTARDFAVLSGRVGQMTNSRDFQSGVQETDKFLSRNPGYGPALGLKDSLKKGVNRLKAEEYIKKAASLTKSRDFESAEAELLKALALDEKSTVVLSALSSFYYETGDLKRSLDAYQKLAKADPTNTFAANRAGEILKRMEEQKPVWMTQGKFYAKETLVFEDFEDQFFVSKFITPEGKFRMVEEKGSRFGRFSFEPGTEARILKTSIRLPDLSKFQGIKLSLRSDAIESVTLVLVEQTVDGENSWELPISGIEKKWKDISIPFRYLMLPSKPSASLDLGKVVRFMFVAAPGAGGDLDIDNIELFK